MPRVPLKELKKQKKDGFPQNQVKKDTSLFVVLRKEICKTIHMKQDHEGAIDSAEQEEQEMDVIVLAAAGPIDIEDKSFERYEPAENREMTKAHVKEPICISDVE